MRKLTMPELGRLAPDAYARTHQSGIVLILDNIRSLNNVGSAFRTADAFGVEALWLCGFTGQPPHREIHRAALGAEEAVPWQHRPTTVEALDELRTAGYALWALEQTTQSVPLPAFERPAGKLALLFGNEVDGVSDEALALCHGAIEVPQVGSKHSLNVSVCIGVALWELVRKG